MGLKKLSPTHLKYCEYVLTGMSKEEAYCKAYPNNKYSQKSLSVRISIFSNDPLIQNEISRLREIVESRIVKKGTFAYEDSVKELLDLMEIAKTEIQLEGLKKVNSSTILECVKELNRMYGYTKGTTNNTLNINSDGGPVVFTNEKELK